MRRLISLLLLLIPTILLSQASWHVVTVPYKADNLNFFTGNGSTYFNVTLTGNVNTSGLNGGSDGMEAIFHICQDNVGGHTFNWPPNVANPPTINSAANSCTDTRFVNIGNFTWNNTGVGNGTGAIATPPGGSPIQTQVNNGGVFGGTPCETFTTLNTGPANINCDWLPLGPNPYLDIRAYGARAQIGTTPDTITVTTNGTATVTTTGIGDFQVKDGLVIGTAGAATTQTTPAAPTVQVTGANGSSTVTYECVGVDSNWGLTAASAPTSVSTAPQVFGAAAVGISSVTWVANVVTVNTSSAMPFNTGTFHVMIGNIVSGGNQIGGIQNATIVSSTQLTYSLTGSGTVSAPAGSSVLFVNGFVLTQVSETKGSNRIVLTTDTNHNIQQQLSTTAPTKLFLDGINFPGELIPGYANGVFTIVSTTANTITVQTPYIATLTENATAGFSFSTSHVNPAQMTVLTYPVIIVTCPQNNGSGIPLAGGAYYAVYANYGSGFAPIGFTVWQHSILFDYGPAFTKAGFVSPPAMNLPATPPVSPQNQVFEAQITAINGSTITLDRSVPQSLTSVTAYRSNGIALQNAVSAFCGPTRFRSSAVLIPDTLTSQNYAFNAPVELATTPTTCTTATIQDSGSILMNGTIMSDGLSAVEWKRGSTSSSTSGRPAGGVTSWFGVGDPMIGINQNSTWNLSNMAFSTQSNGQNAVVNLAPLSIFEKLVVTTLSGNFLSSIPLIIGGSGFQVRLRDISFGNIPNINAPIGQNCSNCGQVMWWPVPSVDLISGPSIVPDTILEGMNYGTATGFQSDTIYPGSAAPAYLKFYNVQTFQGPWQPLLQMWGNNAPSDVTIETSQMDSILMPVVANINCTSCAKLSLRQAYTTSGNNGFVNVLSGNPFKYINETGEQPTQLPTTSQNEFMTSPIGLIANQTIYANAGIVPSAAGFENCNGSLSTNWAPSLGGFTCTGSQIQGNLGSDNIMFWSTLPIPFAGSSQFSETVMSVLGSRSGPGVFFNSPGIGIGGGGYVCLETSTTLSIALVNTDGTLDGTLASTPISGVNGDRVRIEVIRPPFAGTNTINCYLNGQPPSAPTTTATDSTYSTGYPGLDIFGTTVRADNWSGGYLPTVAQASAEQTWTQPQHFIQPVTIGATNPVPGALTTGLNLSQINLYSGANVANMTWLAQNATGNPLLSTSSTPSIKFQDCQTTSTCAQASVSSPVFLIKGGPVAMSGGTIAITNLPFASSTSYVCDVNDVTATNAVQVVYTSGSTVTFNGTTTDSIRYICWGI